MAVDVSDASQKNTKKQPNKAFWHRQAILQACLHVFLNSNICRIHTRLLVVNEEPHERPPQKAGYAHLTLITVIAVATSLFRASQAPAAKSCQGKLETTGIAWLTLLVSIYKKTAKMCL